MRLVKIVHMFKELLVSFYGEEIFCSGLFHNLKYGSVNILLAPVMRLFEKNQDQILASAVD